jgi:CCR4-NOT transcription complex subunit 7/8
LNKNAKNYKKIILKIMSESNINPKEKTSNINMINNSSKKVITEQPGIIEVYSHNFVQEIKTISTLIEEYNYIGMDTEFPGTVYCINNFTPDFYYKTLKLNVDSLKLIQLGITLTNSKGEYPKNYPYHTWQFNLEFDINNDKYAQNSLNLLINSGIDFNKLKKNGIKHKDFAEYFMISGLVLNPNINWISYHGSYDFGYLLHLLINSSLPDNENDFTKELSIYFPNHYDIRILVQGNEKLQGGLNKLAQYLEVLREGKTHQAGSDSVVTIDVFFKLLKNGNVEKERLETDKNILFGLGLGKDDEETITYTIFGNGVQYINPNQNNIMYIPQLNPINYYQYQGNPILLMNNVFNNRDRKTPTNSNIKNMNKVSS